VGYIPWTDPGVTREHPPVRKTAGQTLNAAFGEVVRERRQKAGLSQEKLAELAGLDRTFISELERGLTSIAIRRLDQLAEALGTKPHSLVLAAERRRGRGT